MGDNALLKLAPLLEKLREQPPPEPTEAGIEFLAGVLERDLAGAGPDELAAALAEVRERSPLLAAYLAEPMLGVTLVPTMASGSVKDNVIPGSAEVLVDCRAPPGLGEAEVRERLEAFFGDTLDGAAIEFTHSVTGNASPAQSPLADSIAAWVEASDPGAGVVPIVMPGFSDSHWWRKAFGAATTVYGFAPQRDMSLFEASPLVHSADERVKASRRRFRRQVLPRHRHRGTGVSENGVAPEDEAREKPIRLGGMALRNGLLIHGPTSWAAAARAPRRLDRGRVRARSPPSRQGRLGSVPGFRGPLRLAEAIAVVPIARGACARPGSRWRTGG